jgi:hypothetical protein
MSQSNVSLEPTDCATRVIMSHLPTKEKQTISAHKTARLHFGEDLKWLRDLTEDRPESRDLSHTVAERM